MHSVGPISIDKLLLDPENPRLPERIQGEDQSALLEHLFENDVLDELAASFIANGYFENEPILVLPSDAQGMRIVVEGNRRVSTLQILHQTGAAREAGLSFDLTTQPTESQLSELATIPCYEVSDRDELGAYLGYRHIGGLRPWPAESKARWIHRTVIAASEAGSQDPFYQVGRIVGSNARGVRTAYLTLELLRRARAHHNVNTSYVERNRYSVWGLLVANSHIREYVGLDGRTRTFQAVQDALDEINGARVREIVQDLTPQSGATAILGDSRQVSQYAEVLVNERAHEVLRMYGDLRVAAAVLEQGALTERLTAEARALREILLDASRVDVDESTAAVAGEVAELARSIRAVVADRLLNT